MKEVKGSKTKIFSRVESKNVGERSRDVDDDEELNPQKWHAVSSCESLEVLGI